MTLNSGLSRGHLSFCLDASLTAGGGRRIEVMTALSFGIPGDGVCLLEIARTVHKGLSHE